MAADTDLGQAAIDKLMSGFGSLTTRLPFVGSMLGKLGSTVADIEKILDQNSQTWQQMSNYGASFNNNLLQMTASAAGARLSLSELTTVVQKNAGVFVGLAGNVADGSQMFTRASKFMFDFSNETGNVTDKLRNLGWTNSDLNELLVLQLATFKGTAKTEKEITLAATTSTAKLAEEMDLLAKLTGVSRKEQLETLQNAKTDMIAEARVREISAKTGQDAEKVRALYQQQLNQATINGVGQAFKEQFAYGNVISKEAGEQMSLMGSKTAAALVEQVKATTQGREEDADLFSRQVSVSISELFTSPAFQNIVKINETAQQLFAAGQARDAALTQYIEQKRKEGIVVSREDALEQVTKQAQSAQKAQDAVTQLILQFPQLKLALSSGLNDGFASIAASSAVQDPATKFLAMLTSTKELVPLISDVKGRLTNLAKFTIEGNTAAKNKEEAQLRNEVLSATKNLSPEVKSVIQQGVEALIQANDRASNPSPVQPQSTMYNAGKSIFDFVNDKRPLSVKLAEIPIKAQTAFANAVSQQIHNAVWNALTGSAVTTAVQPPAGATQVPERKAVGGKMEPNSLNVLNVAGTPYFYNEDKPEYVLNQQQVGLMHANFSQSLSQNQKVLTTQQEAARLSMQSNSKFIEKISEISESLNSSIERPQSVSSRELSGVEEQIKESFSTLDFSDLSALIKGSNSNATEVSSQLAVISSKLTSEAARTSGEDEPPKTYSLSQEQLPAIPKLQEVAERAKAEQAKAEQAKAERDARVRAEQDAKLLESASSRDKDTASQSQLSSSALPDKSVETLTAILHSVEKLNMQTRELINQDSRNASNLITATKRASGLV